jgi:hypothetical protein
MRRITIICDCCGAEVEDKADWEYKAQPFVVEVHLSCQNPIAYLDGVPEGNFQTAKLHWDEVCHTCCLMLANTIATAIKLRRGQCEYTP